MGHLRSHCGHAWKTQQGAAGLRDKSNLEGYFGFEPALDIATENGSATKSSGDNMVPSVCHHCGAFKRNPFEKCDTCKYQPQSDDDLVLSLMLSEKYLPREKLVDAANAIRSGQQISFPPAMQAAVAAAMATAKAKAKAEQSNQGCSGIGCAFFAILALVVFGVFHPWAHYQLSCFRDSVSAYQGFVIRFPDSDYVPLANERIRVLREDDVWKEAQAKHDIDAFRRYVKVYPDGKYLGQAKR